MKILIVGASGMIGREALIQCLAHPSVSSVVAFVRRDLPADVAGHPKLECVVIKDFAVWPEDVLQAHSDAAAMIWAMGTYSGSVTVDFEYPCAFVESMGRVLEAKPPRTPFRYVLLSGRFVRQNQEEKLWWGDKPRKIKGRTDTKVLEFAKSHPNIWKSFVVKPGGVVTKNALADGFVSIAAKAGAIVFGKGWTVQNEELGAFMTYLAVSGEGEDALIENERIAKRGRELLESQKQ
ncbi:hypothetical protein GGS26DRAFT_453884 [Hypomontagnella submonticulosa]|nr:hypothetical protein GGS26DRAFT_453884 [Hypomontagnella submonticulosa]